MGIRLLHEELLLRLEADQRMQVRYLEGDTSVADEATLAACARLGLRVEDYRRAVDSEPSLVWLEIESIREAFVGLTDPGPCDRISPMAPRSAWQIA